MFYLDKNVLEIAKMCSKPVDDPEQSSLASMLFFSEKGICTWTNSYIMVKYRMPHQLLAGSPQMELFEKSVKYTTSVLVEPVAIIGKEFAHVFDFKSEMPEVGEYAVMFDDPSNECVEVYWTSGVAETTTKHIKHSKYLEFMTHIDRIAGEHRAVGSKIMVDPEYIKQAFDLAKKVSKTQNDDSIMVAIDADNTRMRITCQNLEITVAGKLNDDDHDDRLPLPTIDLDGDETGSEQ